MADPVISFWDEDGAAQVYSVPLGFVEESFESDSVIFRVYNNKDEYSSINDAYNCRLSAMDDAGAVTPTYSLPLISGSWTKGKFNSYDTSVISDSFAPLGGTDGSDKNWLAPVNDGTLEGSSGGTESHYLKIEIKVAVPGGTTRGDYQGDMVLEYAVS